MISPPPLQVPISAPTGGLTAAWIAWFDSLRKIVADQESAGNTEPDIITAVAALSMALSSALQELQTLPRQPVDELSQEIGAVKQELQTLPRQPVDELSQEIGAVKQELQTLPRPELGTFAALQQASLPWTTFDTTPDFIPSDVGTVAWDGGTTLGIQMTANVLQRVGEAEFVYVKASSAITKGQLCYHTGAVGSSGVITAAPTPISLADPNQIVGVAAETIALNGFGLIQISGDLRGFNTTGSSVGEVWADGDALYYNPAYVGSMTKVKPVAPNQKSYIGEVINAGSGSSGSMHIRIVPGSVLGGTDSNVEISGVANNDVLVYDSVDQRWENYAPTAARDALGLGTGNPSNGQMLIGNGTDFTTAALTAGTGISIATGPGSVTIATGAGVGTVTSVAASGGTTGLTFSGSPITTSGTLTLGGTLDVANGGTGLTATPSNGQIDIGNGSGFTRSVLTAGAGVSITNGAGSITISATGSGGSVTSVGLAMPAQFAVSGSPVTGAGTLTAAWNSQAASLVLASPNGSSGVPTFRALQSNEVGYTQSGGSPTTVEARLRETISVKDFGAVGNGSFDDTTAIQNALNAGTGREVYFPAGTYRISSTLVVKTKTTITGDGINKSIIKLTAGFGAGNVGLRNDVITGTANVYYDTDLAFYNITFDGNSNATRTADLVAILKVANVTFSNCSFQNHTFIGLAMTANKNMKVVECLFTGNGRPKPSTVSAPALWVGTTAAGTPFDIIVENNYFRDNNWSAAYFMPTRGSFSNNICVDNGESTVFCNNTGAYLRIENNTITGAARSNISASGIECGAPYTVIVGNTIDSCGAEGIALTDVQNVTVADNLIFNNGQDTAYYPFPNGITIVGTASSPNQPDHIQIHGNRIGDRQSTKTQYAAIGFSGSGAACTNVAIYNNDFAEQKTATYYNLIAASFGAGCYTLNNYDRNGNLLPPFKYVQFTLNAAAGAQAITGVGFRPRSLKITAVLTSTTQAFTSVGVHDGTSGTTIYSSVDGTGERGGNDTGVINIKDSAGAAVAVANMQSYDIDGFTIDVITGNAAVVCNVECFP